MWIWWRADQLSHGRHLDTKINSPRHPQTVPDGFLLTANVSRLSCPPAVFLGIKKLMLRPLLLCVGPSPQRRNQVIRVITQCTVRFCAALGNVDWTPERDESQGSDRLLRGTMQPAEVPSYPCTLPCRPDDTLGQAISLRPQSRVVYLSLVHLVIHSNSANSCSFVERSHPPRPAAALHNAQRATLHLAHLTSWDNRIASIIHWATLHDNITHITLHCTTTP